MMATSSGTGSGITRSASQRVGGAKDDQLFFENASKVTTMRRAEGKRADSEASASVRGKSSLQSPTDYSGMPSRSLSIGQSLNNNPKGSTPFSSVRRIFRQRSKSISSAMKRPSTADVIPEAEEAGERFDIDSRAGSDFHSSTQAGKEEMPTRRERKTSFFFNRSKAGSQQPKVSMDGLDLRRRSILSPPSLERKRSDASFKSRSTPPSSPLPNGAFPLANSDSRSSSAALYGFPATSSDRAHTWQALGSALRADQDHEERVIATPTPPKRADKMSLLQEDVGTGVAYSTTSPSVQGTPSSSIPRASVPKMWQEDFRSVDPNGAPTHPSRHLTSSATSGSISSYRTAGSTPRPRTPSRAPKSPLSDLIFNLEQRLSDTKSERDHVRPAIAAGPDTPTGGANSNRYIPPPFSSIRHLEDDGESLISSESSEGRRRNTFDGSSEPFTPNQWSSTFHNNTLHPGSTETPIKRRTVGDMSMSEIEESLAAVEAALQDHSVAGSFDPNNLRRKMLTPRHASIMGQEGVTEEDLNDFEMLSSSPRPRVRLPPGQQVAIQEAVTRVRRALSSSQLPQIPNEEDSISEVSHAAIIESTPIKAARIRQESMQDVEEAYARMVDLVESAAGIDLNALSPLPSVLRPVSGNFNLGRQPDTPFTEAGVGNLSYPSPETRNRSSAPPFPHTSGPTAAASSAATATADSTGGWNQQAPAASSVRSGSSSRLARQQLLRESDALARVVALGRVPREMEEAELRGRPSRSSLGSRRYASASPPRTRMDSGESNTARIDHGGQQQIQSRRNKRVSMEASGTSPSATVKTQGTPQSMEMYHHQASMPSSVQAHHSHSYSQPIYDWQQARASISPSLARPSVLAASNGNVNGMRMLDPNRPQSESSNYSNALLSHTLQRNAPRPINGDVHGQQHEGALSRYEASRDMPHSTIALQKRHALERDSLLDMLERSRNESNSLRARNEELEADLHQEVTRFLEMQREISRQREIEQVLRRNEEAMRDRIASLEDDLKKEHADRVRIAELLERVQRAVDNAAKVDADSGEGGIDMNRSTSTDSLLQEHLQPSARHIIDDISGSGELHRTMDSTLDSGQSLLHHTEFGHSPNLQEYPPGLGLDVDEQEMSWSLDQEEPLEEHHIPSTSSHSHRAAAAHGQTEHDDEEEEPVAELERPMTRSPLSPQAKRSSYPSAAASRLPMPSTVSSRSIAANNEGPASTGMTKSTSTTSTLIPNTPTKNYMDSVKRQPVAAPASRIPLAERFGESMIARPRTHHKGSPSLPSTSTSPRSMRNFSSSSSAGFSSLRKAVPLHSSPTTRKLSNFTNTTGGDTSYTARTPEAIDVTTLDFGNDDSFTLDKTAQ